MRQVLRVATIAAALAVPGLLAAQASSKPLSFGVSGGGSLPIGDLADGTEFGFNVAGHIWFKPASMKSLSFRGDIAYDRWGAKDFTEDLGADFARIPTGGAMMPRLNVASARQDLVDANASSLSFTGNAIFGPSSSGGSKPYFLVGGGLYRNKVSVSVLGFEGSATETDPGIQAGAGIEFKLSGFSTHLEARFINVFSEGSSSNWIPIVFGVKF